jgi:glycine betaine/choline ABC-type transport system substrate-binding protein
MQRLRYLVVAGCLTSLLSCNQTNHGLTVGSKNFTEQVILGEIIAQHLEHKLNRKVVRSLNLGGTLLVHQAIMNGQIDTYPEYSGTALNAILKINMVKDQLAIRERLQEIYRTQLQLEWLAPLGFDNSFAMVVRKEDGEKLQPKTLGEASKAKDGWALGMGYEFQERPDGFVALHSNYSLVVSKTPVTMDLGLLYRALDQQQVNMIAANVTDGLLDPQKYTILADDRNAFGTYEATVVARIHALDKYPGMREALQGLAGKIDAESMRRMNYEVDQKHAAVSNVAADFLKKAGI